MPADFKAPEGIEFKFDDKDPLLARAREWAHANERTPEEFKQILGLYAAAKVGEEADFQAAKKAELAKLGASAGPRVDAVIQWMTGMDRTTDKRDAKALANMLHTTAAVEAFERMITDLTSQGAHTFSQRGRETPDEKPSTEEFNSWSYGEQREYSSTGKRPSRAN